MREDAGCVALMRGPLVYCFEQEDNGPNLQTLRIPTDAVLTVENVSDPVLGSYTAVKATGLRLTPGSDLYSSEPPKGEETVLHAIPYYLWGNRSEGAMRVWMPETVRNISEN